MNSFSILSLSQLSLWPVYDIVSCLLINGEDKLIKSISMKSSENIKKWKHLFSPSLVFAISPMTSSGNCLDYLLNNARYLLFYTTLLHTCFSISQK